MNWFRNLSLGKKIVLPLTAVAFFTGVTTYFYFSSLYRQTETDALVTKARAITLSAEAAREFAAEQLANGIFKDDLSDPQKILRTVPIFTAMRVAENRSKELGFTLRVPKFQPRNPKNVPDQYEARILHELEKDGKAETWEIDHEGNQLRFFTPVRLTKECLACHGDPDQSFALWKNHDGRDAMGTKMEGWKEGEVPRGVRSYHADGAG